MARKSDIDTLADRARAGTAAVKALSGAFEDLSAKGRLTASSIMQMAGALGQVHPVLGLVAAGVGLVVAQGERLKQLELQDAMASFADFAKVASREWNVLVAGMTAGAGETGKLRDKMAELAQVNVYLQSRQNQLNEKLAEFADKVKAGTMTEQEAVRATAWWTKNIGEAVRRIQERKEKIEAEIDALQKHKRAIEQSADVEFAVTRELLRMHKEYEDAVRNDEQARIRFSMAQDDAAASSDALTMSLQQQGLAITPLNDQLDTSAEHYFETSIAAQELALSQERVRETAISASLALATNSLNAYYDALDKTVSLNQIFAGGFDRAMRNAAAATIRSVGQQAAVRAIFELAEGWAKLGNPWTAHLATFHFKAAAIFGGIALGAGPAAGLTSVLPAGGGGGGSGRGGNGDGRTGGSGRTVIVNVSGTGVFDDAALNEFARRLREAVEKADT